MMNSKLLQIETQANEFRASLDRVSLEERDLFAYLNKEKYFNSDMAYYLPRNNKPILAWQQNNQVKNIQSFLHYNFKLLDTLTKSLDEKKLFFDSSLSKLKMDRRELNDTFESINLKLKSGYTESYKKSVFKERGFLDILSLKDCKKKSSFLKSYHAEYKGLSIESAFRQIEKIKPNPTLPIIDQSSKVLHKSIGL